ncbi:MAG: cohesin domain-containing protein [Thermodesulfobacteriota bacterium]|nr:cohesin domain-containing protein [Thermodesulfobacteriota bacterium]
MKWKPMFVIVCCLCTLIPRLVLADATVSLENVSGETGTDVVVPVTLSSNTQDVAAMNFTVTYDPNALEYASMVGTDVLVDAEKEIRLNTPIAGQLNVVIYGINQNAISDGVIAYITLTIRNSAGEQSVALDLDGLVACSGDAQSIDSTAVDASVTCSLGSETDPSEDGSSSGSGGGCFINTAAF